MTREAARWAEAVKDVIGTAIDETSRVWFTLASGRLTEIYYPTPDRACTRAVGLVLVGDDFVSEEHTDCIHTYSHPHSDVPLFSVVNRHRDDRYRIEKETIADPRSSVVLQRVRWGRSTATRIVCRLEPHVASAACTAARRPERRRRSAGRTPSTSSSAARSPVIACSMHRVGG